VNLSERLRELLDTDEPVALATVIAGPGTGGKLLVHLPTAGDPDIVGGLGDDDLDRVVARDLIGELRAGRTVVRHYGPQGQAGDETVTVFIESFAPSPRLIIFGAVDFTGALVRVGKVLGYRVTVCDAREVFATPQRFPQADEVVVDWPHRLVERIGASLGPADAICVLTHDHKFDVPAIVAALRTEVGYLGAMGSRRTAAERAERLRAAGVDEVGMARLHAPIGLDIGARTPEETAISIVAEIISNATGRSPASLRDTDGPIHQPVST
jgi:xanthine dehydrogenase accessory factor